MCSCGRMTLFKLENLEFGRNYQSSPAVRYYSSLIFQFCLFIWTTMIASYTNVQTTTWKQFSDLFFCSIKIFLWLDGIVSYHPASQLHKTLFFFYMRKIIRNLKWKWWILRWKLKMYQVDDFVALDRISVYNL